MSSNKSLSENSRVIGQCSNAELIKPPAKQNSVESSTKAYCLRHKEHVHHLHETSNIGNREHWGSSAIRTGLLSQPQLGAGLVLIDIHFGYLGIKDEAIKKGHTKEVWKDSCLPIGVISEKGGAKTR